MCICMFTMPFYVHGLTPDNTQEQWATVFIIHAVVLFISNSIFCFMGQGVAAKFTNQAYEECNDMERNTEKEEQTKEFNNNTV